jgi:hypothetical protein
MLADADSVEPVVATIGRALLSLTQARHAAIFLRSPNGLVTCPWSHNLSDVYVQDIVTPKDANPWMHILRHPELSCMDLPKTKRQTSSTPWFLSDALALSPDHAHLVDRITREGLRSMCAWPLTQAGRVTGAFVYYYDSPHVCSRDEQQVMRAFGSQAASALRDPRSPLSEAQSTMKARDTTGTTTDSQAAFGLKPAGAAPEQQIIDATTPPLADTRSATEDEQARGEIEAARAQLREAQRQLEAERAQLVADRAAFAAERAQITETLEAKTVRRTRDREEPEGAHEAGELHEYTWSAVAKVGPEPGERSNAAAPSRRRQAALVASTVIAAVATAVLVIRPAPHGPAVRTMEHGPATQVSAAAVQKRPVPAPHQEIAAGVVPSAAKAGVPPMTSRALPPRKAAYVVVVGTFESAKTAEEMKRLVQSKGYVVHVVLQGPVSKVMTAPMRTRTQADGVARGLEAAGLRPQVMAW